MHRSIQNKIDNTVIFDSYLCPLRCTRSTHSIDMAVIDNVLVVYVLCGIVGDTVGLACRQ